MGTNLVKYKSYVAGPKWARLKLFLYETSSACGVDFTVTDRDAGLIRETIYYTVEGQEDAVEAFKHAVSAALTAYNNK